DVGKQPLNPWAVSAYPMRTFLAIIGHPYFPMFIPTQSRNQIFCSRKNKDVGFIRFEVFREPSIRASGNLGKPNVPSKSKGPITRSGVVGQHELRGKSVPPRT